MKFKTLVFCIISSFSTTVYAVDEEYLKTLKYKLIGINMKLPKRIDEVTTMEEMRLMRLKSGDYYVATMCKINTNIQSFGTNRDLILKQTIDIGCKDPAVIDYMNHSLKIGIIYKNQHNEMFDAIIYSIDDCKS